MYFPINGVWWPEGMAKQIKHLPNQGSPGISDPKNWLVKILYTYYLSKPFPISQDLSNQIWFTNYIPICSKAKHSKLGNKTAIIIDGWSQWQLKNVKELKSRVCKFWCFSHWFQLYTHLIDLNSPWLLIISYGFRW